jgi:phosphotransferase system IIB component
MRGEYMELYQYIIIIVVLVIIALAISKSTKKDFKLELNKLVTLLGGMDNIIDTEVEMSRFKVTLKDITKANKEGILKLGAKGVVEIDNQLKIILGNNAKQLKKYIDELKRANN